MERVQYQLERSVPQLQLLDENNVFTKEQLRSITTQRQTFEGRLLRRGPDKQDFLRYAEFERNLADLINVKANRIGLPRAFHRDNAAAHTGHIIAIYERLVLKFKYDVDAWQQYIAFAKSRKMRVVTGRVYARALSLHPNNVPLWLAAAAHELNDNASTTAARSLLQRALRLNYLPWKQSCSDGPDASSSRNKRASNGQGHDSNKRPRHNGQGLQDDEDASMKNAISGPVVLKLSSREADLLRLWVEYIRMELVFIERLRRRWLVLGLEWDTQSADEDEPIPSQDAEEAAQAAVDIDADSRAGNRTAAEEEDEDEVQERILLSQVPDKDVDAQPEVAKGADAEPNTFTPRKLAAIPPAQAAILRGNIPHFLIGSALESLAPHLHFVLLLALIELLQTFPFAESVSLDAPKSGQALRHRLLNRVYYYLSDRQRWGWHNFPPAALASSLRPFRPETPFYADKSEEAAAQVANAEEMDSHRLLMSACQLRTTFSSETDGLLELATQLTNGAASDTHKTSVSSSSSLAVQLVLQLLQSLLTEKVRGGSTRPSSAHRRLAETGELPTAVSDALTQLRAFCAQAPVDRTRPIDRSPKSELYTATALLIEMLGDNKRSGIDEPNLLWYLESMQGQLGKEALAAGPGIETAQLRAVTLRKKVDAAIAFEDDEERSKRLTKLKEQLKQATSARQFPGSDELWSLRILVSSHLSRTTSKTVEEGRDSIAAEWRRGLQACSEIIDVEALALTAEMGLWSRFFAWLDHGVNDSRHAGRREVKAAFRYSSEQYRWAVRETASLLSRSDNISVVDLEAVHQYRQAIHDLCVLRYVQLSASLGKHDETISWLLRSSFATHRAWLQIVSELDSRGEEGDADSEQTSKNAQLVEKIFAKLLQVKPNEVEVWISYLQHLAARDMIKALQRLETCRSTLHKSECKLVEKEWQRICAQLQGRSSVSIDDSDEIGISV